MAALTFAFSNILVTQSPTKSPEKVSNNSLFTTVVRFSLILEWLEVQESIQCKSNRETTKLTRT